MPVLDLLGLVKVGVRFAMIALVNPITLFAAVCGLVWLVVDKLNNLFDTMQTSFLATLYQLPLDTLNDWLAGSGEGSFAGWVYYAFALDYVLQFLHWVPDILYYVIVSTVAIAVGSFAAIMLFWFRAVWATMINMVFGK